jgi:hypothetical protein
VVDAVGLGWWVGYRRDTDDFLGWWDLSPDVPVPERPTRAQAGPSRGVMVKLGMRHVRTDHRAWDDPLPGSEPGEVVYEITPEEWIRRLIAPDGASVRTTSRLASENT